MARRTSATELILQETTLSTDVPTPATFQRTPWYWKPEKPSKKRKRRKKKDKPEAVRALIMGELEEGALDSGYWLFGQKLIKVRGNVGFKSHLSWAEDNIQNSVVKKYFKPTKEEFGGYVGLQGTIFKRLKGTDAVRIMIFAGTITLQVDPFKDKILRTLQDKLMTLLGMSIKNIRNVEISDWSGSLTSTKYYPINDFFLANSVNKLKERL